MFKTSPVQECFHQQHARKLPKCPCVLEDFASVLHWGARRTASAPFLPVWCPSPKRREKQLIHSKWLDPKSGSTKIAYDKCCCFFWNLLQFLYAVSVKWHAPVVAWAVRWLQNQGLPGKKGVRCWLRKEPCPSHRWKQSLSPGVVVVGNQPNMPSFEKRDVCMQFSYAWVTEDSAWLTWNPATLIEQHQSINKLQKIIQYNANQWIVVNLWVHCFVFRLPMFQPFHRMMHLSFSAWAPSKLLPACPPFDGKSMLPYTPLLRSSEWRHLELKIVQSKLHVVEWRCVSSCRVFYDCRRATHYNRYNTNTRTEPIQLFLPL